VSRPDDRNPSATIDDLLRFDSEPANERRAPTGWRGLLLAVVSAGLLTGLAVAALRLFDVRIDPVLLFSGFLGLLLLRRFVADVSAPPAPRRRDLRQRADEDDSEGAPPRDGLTAAVRQWANVLVRAADHRRSDPLAPRLGDLVDERLRLRHGFVRADDPGRARELLGPELWQMLERPGPLPRGRDLSAHLERLDRL